MLTYALLSWLLVGCGFISFVFNFVDFDLKMNEFGNEVVESITNSPYIYEIYGDFYVHYKIIEIFIYRILGNTEVTSHDIINPRVVNECKISYPKRVRNIISIVHSYFNPMHC